MILNYNFQPVPQATYGEKVSKLILSINCHWLAGFKAY